MTELSNLSIERELNVRGYSILDIPDSDEMYHEVRREYLLLQASSPALANSTSFRVNELESLGAITKYAIGPTNGSGEPIAQLLITTYLSRQLCGYPALSGLAGTMISLRNRLTEVPDSFGDSPAQDGFWNATRIHHYPVGGGFMQEHVDTGFPNILKCSGIRYLQVSCCLSTKGVDFLDGGGYVIDKQTGKKVYTDKSDEGLRIVCFDGSIRHGVDTPSPTEAFKLDRTKGRTAMFANLYTYQG